MEAQYSDGPKSCGFSKICVHEDLGSIVRAPVYAKCPDVSVRSACQRLFCDPTAGQTLFRNNQERDYYNFWFRLLSIDSWAAYHDFARVLDQKTLSERILEGITLKVTNLKFQESKNHYGEDSQPQMDRAPAEASDQSGATRCEGTNLRRDNDRECLC